MTPVRRVIAAFCCAYVALAATFWAAPSTSAEAKENELFGIAPHPETVNGTERASFVVPREPGAIFEDQVRIYNKSGQTLDLAIYAADAEAGQDGTISVSFRTSDPKGVGSWIDLSRDDVQLPGRQELVVSFRIEVKNADPSPSLGAIVVENTGRGISGDGQKLNVLVRTDGPNTETTSTRVRPLVLRSPWIIIAVAGLVLAAALVWIGARRARHPKDVVVAPGELEHGEADEVAPEASRPVIKRLGKSEEPGRMQTAVLERSSTRSGDKRAKRDERPLLDDALLVEVDPVDDEEEDDGDEIVWIDAEGDLEDDDYYEDEDVEDEPLPPARHRESAPPPKRERAGREPVRVAREPRAATTRTRRSTASAKSNASARNNNTRKNNATKSNARKPAKKKPARAAATKKPAPRKATARKPARSAATKESNAKTNFIPLDDL